MLKNFKRFTATVLALVITMCSFSLPAMAAENSSAYGENQTSSSSARYSVIADARVTAGPGERVVSITIPAGKTAKQFGISGTISGGNVPSGATGVIQFKNLQEMFQMGTYEIFDLSPALQVTGPKTVSFIITPNNPYENLNWYYGIIIYGN